MSNEQVLEIIHSNLRKVRKTGGTNIMAVCPFHVKSDGTTERTPSFTMNTVNGLYHCFSCHVSGNLETFLNNIGVPGAVITKVYGDLIAEVRNKTAPPRSALHTNFLGFWWNCLRRLVGCSRPVPA